MQQFPLPNTLKLVLDQHVKNADIAEDEELKHIMGKLSSLNTKVEDLKRKALENKRAKE